MVYAQPGTCPRIWDAKDPLEFWDTNGSANLSQTTRPYYNQQQEKKDFAVPADHRVK